jgi:acetyl/propionyl-CoA carboxylase alpha subunit
VTVDVEIGGRHRQIELGRTADGWQATLDGRVVTVDVSQAGAGWSFLIRDHSQRPTTVGGPSPSNWELADGTDGELGVNRGRSSYEVSIRERGPGDLSVRIGGHSIDVRVLDPRAYRRRGPGQAVSDHSGVRQVLAPMPGRVVKVLVKAGDRVAARQGLVVVEAMKMENELRAPGDAIVRDVRTTEGSSVEAGAVLVILD